MEVLRWIRRNMEPRVRLQDFGSAKTSFITSFVSELPPFANRSVFLGDVILSQIFQTPKEELEERRKILLYIVESETPRMISDLAQKAKIEYILDSSGPGSPFRMPEASSFFKMAYSEGNVALYKVNTVAIENEMRNSVILLERNGERLLSSRYAKNFYPPEPVEVNLFSRWISNEGEIQVESSTETQGVLVFIVQSMGKNRTMQISLDDHVIFEQTISLSSMKVRVPVKFEPGQHTLRIHSVEGAERANVYFGGSDKRILSFRMWFLHFRPEK
jgi:hypothetical protein